MMPPRPAQGTDTLRFLQALWDHLLPLNYIIGSRNNPNSLDLGQGSGGSSTSWPGFFWFRTVRYYDEDIDSEQYGTPISGDRARWVKVVESSAEYYAGPVPSGAWPANVWYFDTENPQCYLPF
jgi:hypothetical protein